MAQQETFNNGADEFSYMGEMGSGPDDVSKTPSAQELAQQELDRLRSSKPSTPAAWKSYDPSDPERSGRNLPLGNSSALRRAETATEGEDNRTVVPLTRAQIA